MLFGKYVNRYYLKYGIYFLIGVLTLVGIDVLQLYLPEYLGDIVDILNAGVLNDETIGQIYRIVWFTLGIGAAMMVGRIVWRLTLFKASSSIEADLRYKMFLKAERLSQNYYHDNKIGTIISWFTTDLENIEEVYGFGMVTLVDGIFMSIFVLIKMFILDWFLSIIVLVPVLLLIAWGFLVEKYMTMKWDERQKALDEIYDFAQENFSGIRVIKAFVKQTQQLHAFAKIARKNQDVNVEFTRLSTIFDVAIEAIIALVVVIIMGVGGYIVIQSVLGNPITFGGYVVTLTSGELVTFMGYFDLIIWPVIAFGRIFISRSRGAASLKRISAFLDLEEDIKNPANPQYFQDVKGKITFKHFSYSYATGSRRKILDDINITINPGETIGVVGKIGSGKTTLMSVLLRLYNVDEGTVFIDDVDMMKADITSWRDQIAFVPQEHYLYSDTIANNIAFYDENLPQVKIEEGARFACIHDDIAGFTNGYQTLSSEAGVSLSGGQKQRISIARAYVKDAPIMILDDSVSSVDIKTEETILENIKEQRKGKTTILIASRVSTVMHLDKILVLDNGHVEGFDSHENLLKTSKTYQTMVYLQELEKELEGGEK